MKSIGVSNFLPEHIDRLIAETGVSPVVNQIELHPYFSQPKQRQYDQEHQIITWAWSPIGRASSLLQDPVIKGIAAEVHRSQSQVILRWETQLQVLPIPKLSHFQRQVENLQLKCRPLPI